MNRRDFGKMLGGTAIAPLALGHAAHDRNEINNRTGVTSVDPGVVSRTVYDAVIVGSGVAGAIAAKELSRQGKTVLILEAGTNDGLTNEGFQGYVENFYSALAKHSNSPYPSNPNALSPTDGLNGYFEEQGPLPVSGSYTRVAGGTTMHWEGKALRMLPEDFELSTKYNAGLDWPIGYNDLDSHYQKAEYEIGVAGDVEEQRELGIPFQKEYVFPMKRLPPSYLDEQVRKIIDNTVVHLDDAQIPLKLSTFPQGRNSEHSPDNNNHYIGSGIMCQGSASCVPICPMQAKYDARRTLNSVTPSDRVHMLTQSVASRVEIDSETGRVTGIHYKHYRDKNAPEYSVGVATGHLFVLAANAVENARLMLASHLPNTSGLMGCNLMDHPFILTWALMPETVGSMRGPIVTSGIGNFRKGAYRKTQAAFSVDIHNDGWGWAGIGATDILRDIVDIKRKYGAALRHELENQIPRQLLLAFMCEMPAQSTNRVSVDPRYTDQLGNFRPVINFDIPDYCKKTMAYARTLSQTIFNKLGAEDHTNYEKSDPAYFEYEGNGYWFRGGNHFSGTHIMGTSKLNSVVNSYLRSWDHSNLYLLGAGGMPSIGSANTTLTIAALSYRASGQMLKDLA